MIDPVSITVSDAAAAERFDDAIMKTLDVVKVGRRDDWLGYGERARSAHPDRVYLTIRRGAKPDDAHGRHWCFKAKWRTQVDAFWDAGIAAGGIDDGAPGLRDYHASYYGAFLRDPDGNRVEAVSPRGVGPCTASLARAMANSSLALRQINTTGKSPKVCPDLRAKIFPLHRRANQKSNSARIAATRGAIAIVTTVL